MDKRLLDSIINADKVLIGIGESFEKTYLGLMNDEFGQLEKEEPLLAGYKKMKYKDANENTQIKKAYEKLYELVKDKDYFIITTCVDDRIYDSGFSHDRIVAPCGTFKYLQCEDNCQEELLEVTDDMVINEQQITCPHCGKPACFNQITAPIYNEKGYLPMWEKYTGWLQRTLNKELCVIELGVSMKYPTVIRWPFEKVVFYNKKALLYRINDNLYQLAAEMKDKGISIKENPVSFLTE